MNLAHSHKIIATLALIGALLIGPSISVLSNSPTYILFLLVGGVCVSAAFLVHERYLFSMFLVYVAVEGTVKIFTDYNPIFRVFSDVLLLFVFFRLFMRKQREKSLEDYRWSDATHKVTPWLMLLWIWVAVQFLNPWGLGLLPSLAALKIYVMPILIFFIVTRYLKRDEVEMIPYLILGLGVVHGVTAAIDGYLGDNYLPNMHYRYIVALKGAFTGALYRPFGLTAVPGMPSVWITHCLVGGFIAIKLAMRDGVSPRVKWATYIAAGVFVVFGIGTLLLCQVRLSLIRFVLLGALGVLFIGRGRGAKVGLSAVAVLLVSLLAIQAVTSGRTKGSAEDVRFELISERFSTLKTADTWTESRHGALDAMLKLSQSTALGIGLSRVGASSSFWRDRIEKDPKFGTEWSFADSLYRALFTELGIFGLLAYVMLAGSIVLTMLGTGTFSGKMTALGAVVILLSGFGSEGVLYAPDSTFFWLYAGMGLKPID